jgi:hypothetical protein
MSTQSVTGIANRALQLLGAGSILNLTDNTPEARECTRAYDACRRAELRKHVWNFAIARAALAPDALAPAFGYTYQFSLPVDCVRVLLPADAGLDWKMEGRKLLTNDAASPYGTATTSSETVLNLAYITDVTDPTVFDPLFCEALSAAMAAAMCERLTQSNQKEAAARAAYKDAMDEAKHADALENLPAEAPDDGWWLARVN